MEGKLTRKEIKKIYKMISSYYKRYLKQHGVKMPKLAGKKGFTKDALTLVYLAQGYPNTRKVSKEELTEFVRRFYPRVTDVQQARHLGQQKGWFIVTGTRGNGGTNLIGGEYQLVTLEEPYPAFHGHRIETAVDWENIKAQYGYRCATCGSKEGEPHFHYPNTITQLQKAHKNPNKELVTGNVIPMCQKCNRPDRNNWVYDERGRVVELANPTVIKRSDKEIRWEVYRLLYEEFKGVNPLK